MANDLTDLGENAMCLALVGTTAKWLALYTAVADAEAGTATEVSGGSYGRVDASGSWAAAASGAKATNADISFTEATGDWGTVTHFGLCTAETAGDIILIKALTASRAISTGITATFAAGDLTVDFTEGDA